MRNGFMNDEDYKWPLEQTAAELLEGVHELEKNLSHGFEVSWKPTEKDADGVISLGYPDYPNWLWDGVWGASILLKDALRRDYRPYMEQIREGSIKPVHALNLDELAALFMYYVSAERFRTGFVAEGVKDGIILEMARRLLVLVPDVKGIEYRPRGSQG